MLRPWLGRDGKSYVTINTGRRQFNKDTKRWQPERQNVQVNRLRDMGIDLPLTRNAATLTKEAWQEIDRTVIRATRQRLRAWNDLAASSTRGGFNAMAKTTLEYQAMTDPGEAVQDMDALTEGRRDRPLFNLKSIPLPITHSDFSFSMREIAVSRNTGTPLDTTMQEAAGRRVGELIEKITIGVETGMTYGTVSTGPTAHTGTSTVYGYTNFPYRVVKTNLHTPTFSSGVLTNPDAIMGDILDMIETMQTNGFFGPYMLYHSTGYSRVFNDDYFRAAASINANRTVRERIMAMEGIMDIRRLDYLTSGYQMILVQMDPEVAQAIDGLGITTVQWEEKGGLDLHFKVMAIMVPLLKSPYSGVAGVIHATTS